MMPDNFSCKILGQLLHTGSFKDNTIFPYKMKYEQRYTTKIIMSIYE
jgi:hypothetical protein